MLKFKIELIEAEAVLLRRLVVYGILNPENIFPGDSELYGTVIGKLMNPEPIDEESD